MNICTIDGCGRAHRARGLCASHYNQTHRKTQYRDVPCTVCGRVVVKNGPGRKRRPVCSDRCRYQLTFGRDIAEHRELVGPIQKLTPTAETGASPTPSRRWVAGPCGWCGRGFVGTLGAIYCSRHCARKVGKVRRRARERGADGSYTWSAVIRIYLMLGGCAYCGQPTTDVQPDHVIPLSRGGSNSITNIVPCCRTCNTDKGSLTPSEWAAARARCGLESLPLDPRVRHLTDALLAA